MNNPFESKKIKNGWEDSTEVLKERVKNFIVNSKDKHYSHITDFHISGMNSDLLTRILSGEVNARRIEVFWENNLPKNIHVLYDSEGTGHDIDIYISEKALLDLNIINPSTKL